MIYNRLLDVEVLNIMKIFPEKLKKGDTVMVVAPSSSLGIISENIRNMADRRFKQMGLNVVFGKHVNEIDSFNSSSISSRVDDIHNAFSDKNIKAIFAVIGGFNCNQLLRYVDWDLIRKNPKIFIGYSDTTALQNAIFAKTGLVAYSGPAYSTFGQELYFDYTLDYFKKCVFFEDAFNIKPSDNWSDDEWYKNQNDRKLYDNKGWLVINEGNAKGTILGANICTFNLLQGTEYFPDLSDTVLFLEDDEESKPVNFDRDLQSIIHQPSFNKVNGIVLGRFQNASRMEIDSLVKIIKSKKELDNIPVLANVDFGHTSPMFTFPIGGYVEIVSSVSGSEIKILKH